MDPGKKGMEPAVWVAVPPPPRTSGPRRPDHASGSAAEPLDHETRPCGCEDVGWLPTCAAPLGNRDSNPEHSQSPGLSCQPLGQPRVT